MSVVYSKRISHHWGFWERRCEMKEFFKAGDLVFEVTPQDTMILIELLENDCSEYPVKGFYDIYTNNGRTISKNSGLTRIFHATPENRDKLVAIWGEEAVPKLPLSPQEITLRLLESQKYQLCKVSNHSTQWEFNNVLKAVVHIGVFNEFIDNNGASWTYGIPVDNNGNEITEIE